jgi:SAM-dependent methyltransferase
LPELLIGCGPNRDKKLCEEGRAEWSALTTLDINADHKPDVVHDLNVVPLPFADDTFDEIHAYEVLEHCGTQGDYRFFFAQWADFWRILKPGGMFFATVPLPTSVWAWGDPSHTRVIPRESLTFLSQAAYEQVGRTAMSDFRYLYQADFVPVFMEDCGEVLAFALKAMK